MDDVARRKWQLACRSSVADSAQRLIDYCRRSRPIARLFAQTLGDQSIERIRHVGSEPGRGWRRGIDDREHQRLRPVSHERSLPRRHLEQHRTERVYVGARVRLAEQLLRRHVGQRAHDHPRLRHPLDGFAI